MTIFLNPIAKLCVCGGGGGAFVCVCVCVCVWRERERERERERGVSREESKRQKQVGSISLCFYGIGGVACSSVKNNL